MLPCGAEHCDWQSRELDACSGSGWYLPEFLSVAADRRRRSPEYVQQSAVHVTLIAETRISRDLDVWQVRFPQQMSRALYSDACGSVQNSLARGHFIGGAKP